MHPEGNRNPQLGKLRYHEEATWIALRLRLHSRAHVVERLRGRTDAHAGADHSTHTDGYGNRNGDVHFVACCNSYRAAYSDLHHRGDGDCHAAARADRHHCGDGACFVDHCSDQPVNRNHFHADYNHGFK
jgi:hypothetical protein